MKRVSAILLAAGRGERAHGEKPTLPWGHENFLTKTYRSLIETPELQEVLVVLGFQAFRWTPLMQIANAKYTINPMFDLGMQNSINWGLRHLKKDYDLVLLARVDQPHLETADYQHLIAGAQRTSAGLIQPVFENKTGTPVLVAKKYLPEIQQQIAGEGGCESLFVKYPGDVAGIEMPDSKCLVDFKSKESLEAYLEPAI